jgi:hypothetical protein
MIKIRVVETDADLGVWKNGLVDAARAITHQGPPPDE